VKNNMTREKIDPVKLKRYLREGKSQREISRIFGVSDSAVSQRLKCLNLSVARATQLEHGHAIVIETLDCVQQLHSINNDANYILDLLMRSVKGEPRAVKLLKQHDELGAKIRFQDPKVLALQAMREIRSQLKLQLEILNSVANFEAISDFQKQILDIVGEMDIEMRKKFVDRLKEEKALRAAVRLG